MAKSVNVALAVIGAEQNHSPTTIFDALMFPNGTILEKRQTQLFSNEMLSVGQSGQLKNPDAVIHFDEMSHGNLLL